MEKNFITRHESRCLQTPCVHARTARLLSLSPFGLLFLELRI